MQHWPLTPNTVRELCDCYLKPEACYLPDGLFPLLVMTDTGMRPAVDGAQFKEAIGDFPTQQTRNTSPNMLQVFT